VTTGAASFFDAMAESYDDLEPWYEHLYAVLHPVLRAELRPPPGGPPPRALDVGCGTGFQTAILLELGYETLGLDVSAGALRAARSRCARAHLLGGDAEALPCRDETMDLVTSCGSTLSFVPHPERAFAEIARVLRPGGRLLFEVEHRWSLDLGWRLASSLVGDPLGYRVRPREAGRALAPPLGASVAIDYPGYPPLRLFTRPALDRLLAAHGLRPVRVWGIHGVTNVIPSTVLHQATLSRPTRALYRGLRALDRALAGTRAGRAFPNSLVVLAAKRPR
jgi:SAM-dependent methyltransferase